MAIRTLDLGSAVNGRIKISVKYDSVTLVASTITIVNDTNQMKSPTLGIQTTIPFTDTLTAGTRNISIAGLQLVASIDEYGNHIVSLPAQFDLNIPFGGFM